jgi:hypothetical protein
MFLTILLDSQQLQLPMTAVAAAEIVQPSTLERRRRRRRRRS